MSFSIVVPLNSDDIYGYLHLSDYGNAIEDN
jgi:hypothetical protein